jgi:hypothetical protein
MGVKIGEKGLDRFAPPRRLERIRNRVRKSGAVVLAAGALEVKPSTFFITLGVCRLVRFGTEALLALIYGRQLLGWIDSDIFHDIVAGAMVLAVALTVLSMLRFVRATRSPQRRRASA